MTTRIITGDCRAALATMPTESVHMVVTSPPYWGLRDYGTEPLVWGGEQPDCEHEWSEIGKSGQRQRNGTEGGLHEGRATDKLADNVTLHPPTGSFCLHCGAWRGSLGLEPTPALYIDHMVEVFREVRRVLRRDGTLWLNIGDSYAGSWGAQGRRDTESDDPSWHSSQIKAHPKRASHTGTIRQDGLKPKDLIGIPWALAFALRSDGWWLRCDIIWSKPNPMPESVEDRCTKAHEYLFLLSKNERYHYDADAIRETAVGTEPGDIDGGPQRLPDYRQPNSPQSIASPHGQGFTRRAQSHGSPNINRGAKNAIVRGDAGPLGKWPPASGILSRNKRSVWTIATTPFPEAHFATFPPDLVEPCILAGCPADGTVLDPFGGAGTVGLVADRLRRHAILVELNPEYADMARRRIERDAGMFAEVAAE